MALDPQFKQYYKEAHNLWWALLQQGENAAVLYKLEKAMELCRKEHDMLSVKRILNEVYFE